MFIPILQLKKGFYKMKDLRTIKLEHNTLEEFVLREFGISSSHRCEFLISTVTETAKISAINFKDSDFEHVMLNPQNRLPTYEEMVSLKEIFWEQGEVTMQVHPAKSEYINIQKYTLHLWRHRSISANAEKKLVQRIQKAYADAKSSYYSHENKFHSVMANSVVCAPELGFMFPTFDDRTANIYSTLFYTKNTEQSRDDVVDALFKCNIPMPAEKQKEVFETIISDSLNEDCSFEITQSVHEKLCEMIADHKESKDNEPLVVSKETVKKVLESSGAEQKHIDEFDKKYDETFGSGTEIPPANLVDTKRFEVSTPDVVVKVNPERSDLVETRIIDGTKYILIRADDNVQVNGVQIHIH